MSEHNIARDKQEQEWIQLRESRRAKGENLKQGMRSTCFRARQRRLEKVKLNRTGTLKPTQLTDALKQRKKGKKK